MGDGGSIFCYLKCRQSMLILNVALLFRHRHLQRKNATHQGNNNTVLFRPQKHVHRKTLHVVQ